MPFLSLGTLMMKQRLVQKSRILNFGLFEGGGWSLMI